MKLLQTLSHKEVLENAWCCFAKILKVYFESMKMLLSDSLAIKLSNDLKGNFLYKRASDKAFMGEIKKK